MTLQSLLESGDASGHHRRAGLGRRRRAGEGAPLLESIAPYVDAINATDNPAAHAHASNVSIAIAMQQAGVEPIMQVVCRDKNRHRDPGRHRRRLDVRRPQHLRADRRRRHSWRRAGGAPRLRPRRAAGGQRRDRSGRRAHYVSGRKIEPAPDLFVGAVENPFAPPMPYRIERAKIKSDAGARFLQLQIGYQPERLEAFVAGCVENGRHAAARHCCRPSCLVKRAGALRFMDREVPGISVPAEVIDRVDGAADEAEEAYQHTLEQARHALSLPGVAGLHLTDFRHDGSLGRLVDELGRARRARAQQDAS